MSELSYVYPDRFLDEMKINSAMRDRRIFISEEVDRESMFKACYLLDRLSHFDKQEGTKKDIEIILDSYGGVCYHGLALISKILSMREDGYRIITTVNSVAMSMGFMILLCGSYRRGLKHSRIMCHQPSSATWGTLQDQIESVEETIAIWNRLKELITKYTKITDEQLEDIKRRKFDWFMWSEEALELGVIDHII
ncbi:ATP-dependent Clp protease proteolytic subunit [uncultured Metabacillus sp.]|uniref:ATP-dependent Clp protease proteolytic subunit n=1 Tax=uncultured Metabacillus sp. TaxID=2860135 RepID=UPI00262A7EF7|nr:ATP-dependent Clp protease proteolytic subunit [uncultured Metabacillus sp.]